ncbi:hypothetical protein [Pusillimonas sp. NJUB218]|uniref:phage tail assembly chaperone n=1 Tax=Pusillimonas sp. NJUB218 TaxID=2023230 RepID=UPI000F4B85B9|nr:hypothetical protein [Pusillimonas sp. NJUB218]ROT45002.1 hypothetical protein CHR62_09125 [Pusillimonas sp. NJUB218]
MFDLERKTESGESLRQVLEQVRTKTGITPAALQNPPELPEGAETVWGWFQELAAQRQQGINGGMSLSFTEIDAWGRLRGIRLARWQLDLILRLDALLLMKR